MSAQQETAPGKIFRPSVPVMVTNGVGTYRAELDIEKGRVLTVGGRGEPISHPVTQGVNVTLCELGNSNLS